MEEDIDLKKLIEDEDSTFDKRVIEEVESKEEVPAFNSEKWTEYVMSKFEDYELEDGRPVADALFRVTQQLIGPIIDRKIISFSPASTDNHYNSTVHVRLKVLLETNNHPLKGICDFIEQDGIAEVNPRNTPAPYHMHPSASAFTKAEAQALRKLLYLNKVVAADEVSPDELVAEAEVFTPKLPIQEEQITIIDRLCNKLNISVQEYINSGKKQYSSISNVEFGTAQEMIKFLSSILGEKKNKPQISSYDKDWRKKDGSAV